MRLIDAEKTFEVLIEYYHQRTTFQHYALREALDRVPTVDAVKHGHWVTITDEPFADKYKCSECDKEPLIADCEFELTPYCPFCGAKMDEEVNGNN